MSKNIIIFILTLAFIAIVVFLDLPIIQETLSLRKDLKEQEEELSEKQTLLVKIENLIKDYQGSQEDLKRISYILPTGQDLPNLIIQLEALAFEAGLVLEAVDFSAPEEQGVTKAQQVGSSEEIVIKKYQTLNINLKLIGDYLAFKNFLKLIEENIRLIDIVSVNFSFQSSEGFQFLNFDLNLKTYYQ